jgi:hypothetical protein
MIARSYGTQGEAYSRIREQVNTVAIKHVPISVIFTMFRVSPGANGILDKFTSPSTNLTPPPLPI